MDIPILYQTLFPSTPITEVASILPVYSTNLDATCMHTSNHTELYIAITLQLYIKTKRLNLGLVTLFC